MLAVDLVLIYAVFSLSNMRSNNKALYMTSIGWHKRHNATCTLGFCRTKLYSKCVTLISRAFTSNSPNSSTAIRDDKAGQTDTYELEQFPTEIEP